MSSRTLLAATAVVLAASTTALAGIPGADAQAQARGVPVYLDTAYSPAERAADLVSRMTLAEKAAEMNSSQAAAIPRLGVAAYGWWNEAGHGVAREQTIDAANPPTLVNTTSYPVDLSLGSTWNPDLVYREATLISDEAREVVRDNRLDLDFYSPTVNLARDPRWGRNDETFGEDPLLTAALAAQFVNGMQGHDRAGPAAARLRRLPARRWHDSSTTRRTTASSTGSPDRPIWTSVRCASTTRRSSATSSSPAEPGAIMSAYNQVNGVPSPADVHLIDTLARQTFGFDGYFTSDCDAVYVMQAGQHWQPPGAPAPVDRFEPCRVRAVGGRGPRLRPGLPRRLQLRPDTIPAAIAAASPPRPTSTTRTTSTSSLVRLFTARIELGEFDAEDRVPWVAAARRRLARGTWINSDANHAVTETPQRLAMARRVADQSIVLLKNDVTA